MAGSDRIGRGGFPRRPWPGNAGRERDGGERDFRATLDEPASGRPKPETAVLAGGCFWGVQGVYQHVKGVQSAQSGYAGGDAATANYDAVTTETTATPRRCASPTTRPR